MEAYGKAVLSIIGITVGKCPIKLMGKPHKPCAKSYCKRLVQLLTKKKQPNINSMKNYQLAILTLCIIFFAGSASAQITLGPRIGMSSSQVKIDRTTDNGLELETGDRVVGFHVGAFARISLLGLYVQPEILFTSAGGEVELTDASGTRDQILEYDLNKLDIPVMAGTKIAFFRLQAGPVFSFLLDDGFSASEDVNLNNAVVGYQAGIGLDISKLVIDVKYEGNLSKVGDRIEGINVDQRANQFLLSVGWKLF